MGVKENVVTEQLSPGLYSPYGSALTEVDWADANFPCFKPAFYVS